VSRLCDRDTSCCAGDERNGVGRAGVYLIVTGRQQRKTEPAISARSCRISYPGFLVGENDDSSRENSTRLVKHQPGQALVVCWPRIWLEKAQK
jgi:hypothetical protein